MFVPQVIWHTGTDTGQMKFSEAVDVIRDEDFTVQLDPSGECVIRVTAGQASVPYVPFGNVNCVRVTAGTITDGARCSSATTRGGIRGTEGLTVSPFNTRMTVMV